MTLAYLKKSALALLAFACAAAGSENADAESVKTAMRRAADRQIANPIGDRSIRDWTMAPFYDGLIATARATGDAKYLAEVIRFGDSAGWTPGLRKHNAEDIAAGGAWLEIYLMDEGRGERLEQIRSRLSEIIDGAKDGKSGACNPSNTLFMTARVCAKLYKATGDEKFAQYMDAECKKAYVSLCGKEKTESGEKRLCSLGQSLAPAGLCSVLDDLPADYENREFYEKFYRELAADALAAQNANGGADAPAFLIYSFAWGVNNGILGKECREAALNGWKQLASVQDENGKPAGGTSGAEPAETGAFLMAGGQISKMLGTEQPKADKELYAEAADMHLNRAPEAFVKIEPRRADDIAWENDKCAFRMYGPALETSVENGGIDVWGKTVDYPIISRWYDGELREGKSYHQDRGEGMDSYNVGDSVGCGGDMLVLADGTKVRSNVYKYADIFWTPRDELRFALNHCYEVAPGEFVTEFKEFSMKMGDSYFSVASQFRKGRYPETVRAPELGEKNAADAIPAFGIRVQSEEAKIVRGENFISVDDKMAGADLGQVVWTDKKYAPEQLEGKGEILMRARPIGGGYEYRAGYSFGKIKGDSPAKTRPPSSMKSVP